MTLKKINPQRNNMQSQDIQETVAGSDSAHLLPGENDRLPDGAADTCEQPVLR